MAAAAAVMEDYGVGTEAALVDEGVEVDGVTRVNQPLLVLLVMTTRTSTSAAAALAAVVVVAAAAAARGRLNLYCC